MEVASQLLLAREFGYIQNSELYEECLGLTEEIAKMIYALSKN